MPPASRPADSRLSLGEWSEDVRSWCRGRLWFWRAPILLYLAYAGVRHLFDPLYGSWFGGITLGIHELGHVVFSPFGHFVSSAAGSGCQIAVPLVAVAMFFRQRDWFGIAVAFAWLGFSAYNLATYVGDAQAMELPLVGLSDDPEHDWHYLLSTTHLLWSAGLLAFLIRVGAFLSWAFAMALGGWTIRLMMLAPTSPPPAAVRHAAIRARLSDLPDTWDGGEGRGAPPPDGSADQGQS